MGDEPAQRRFDAAEMADDAENQMLAARAFRTRQRRSERVQKLVNPLPTFEPASD